ncbi:MAG: glucosamine-6-phosphate deaminase [bacterium]|nr:glucosamine-6-phosphate deaminase [bacterium]
MEKIKAVIVDNFPLLGKLTALRFLEWVQANPGGVISLPTGKTPEHFIKWTEYFLNNWNKKEVQKELEENSIGLKPVPDMKSLSFVQIDEFYPILPKQQNSFYYYINKYYISGFGLDKKKALLIDTSRTGVPEHYDIELLFPDFRVDLSLRCRYPKTHLEVLQKEAILAVDQYCTEYEQKIRDIGGIGFFLGGIGPDGHIGFNISGSDFFSTTRLTPVNYETAAAAAGDLGGIEISRNRLVITIGLSTITFKKEAVAIIIAAGEAKAGIVARAIQNGQNIKYPATVLQKLTRARFFLTEGAASRLTERNYFKLKNKEQITEQDIRFNLINYCLEQEKSIGSAGEAELRKDRFTQEILARTGKDAGQIKDLVESGMRTGLNKGAQPLKDTVILHTSPHHDDEMLGYLPYITRLVRESTNKHYFAYMTSGFTAVTNRYMLSLLENLKYFLDLNIFKPLIDKGYFDPANAKARNEDIYHFLEGLAAENEYIKNEAKAFRLFRILIEVLEETEIDGLMNRINEMISYFQTQYPGKKDLEYIQSIKGMVREFEAELLWGYFGFETSSVKHLRLGFYTGDIFTKQPEMEEDILPVLDLLKQVKPDVVTVALDPEGSGPDTHYKVLQSISEALKLYEKETGRNNIRIWGYRNVWYRFHPADANLYIPASLNSLSILNHAFLNCFGSQKDASFPSYEYDGPFSFLAQKIYVEQYRMIKTLLGEGTFYNNPHPMIRASRGLVFLKELSLEEFYQHSMELKKLTELVK